MENYVKLKELVASIEADAVILQLVHVYVKDYKRKTTENSLFGVNIKKAFQMKGLFFESI